MRLLMTCVVWSLLTVAVAAGEDPLVVDVWPGKLPPGDPGIPGTNQHGIPGTFDLREEMFFELVVDGKPYTIADRPTKWLTYVSKPTLTIYRPAEDKNTGVAVLVCPGGGYHKLGWDVEGVEVAEWLSSIGITGIILKYRCPRRPGEPPREPAPRPLHDAQRAVSLVRSQARQWGIEPNKIGMVGFSAGGHLVGATATNFDQRSYEPIDEVDQISCRPDFGIMVYPGYLNVEDKPGRSFKDELNPAIRVSAKTPPILLLHASDDEYGSNHSVVMYLALKRAGVPTELHIYASGGHGFGVRKVGHPCATWTDRCVDWLANQGLLSPITVPTH